MFASAFMLMCLTALGVGGVDDDDDLDQVVEPLERVERLWDQGTFTEGGATAADGSILFSDIGDRIMRFNPSTGETKVFREPSGRANGMIIDGRGRLIVAEGANTGGGRRISITDPDGDCRTLADRFEGKRFNSPNDVAIDDKGRVYFTDPRYVGDEPRELDFEGVFRIDPDGRVTRLETGAKKPNGLVVSPDGETLYVADNGPDRRALLAVDIDDDDDDDDDKDSKIRVIHDFGEESGIDGMTITVDGRIVGATAKGAAVFTPEGRRIALIPTPEPAANVEFGGDGGRVLYILAGKSLYRIPTTMTGYHVSPR
ncbi:SMP-30/gluconolactonase/LRE family protein [Planctomyces sp. SH-PL62]|uniref:SMP-30/gluconolactonase/LRE family protein n=1 Tax=Planctomyces sp. SH-PL62 TaxID=1636152 RepID=UPI00078DE5CC|nr:SMP-30/gluconolactonase/LRE family protein [Planctomyces sp. SH-PL62]AMV40383.1 Gluconolactonase precursor [Planctomyces sp. SH-PL62]